MNIQCTQAWQKNITLKEDKHINSSNIANRLSWPDSPQHCNNLSTP